MELYRSYLWESYFEHAFKGLLVASFLWSLIILVFVGMLFLYCFDDNWKRVKVFSKGQRYFFITLFLLGPLVQLQDVLHAYIKIELATDQTITAAKAERFPKDLRTLAGETLDADILYQSHYQYTIPTTYLGRLTASIFPIDYSDWDYFPFVVTDFSRESITVRLSSPRNYSSFSEEISLLESEKEDGWDGKNNPYDQAKHAIFR